MGFKLDFLRSGALPTVALSPVVSEQTLEFNGRLLSYRVRRSTRQSLAMQVLPEGAVQVSAPWKVPQLEIELFIRRHQRWLEKRLRLVASTRLVSQLQLNDGVRFPLFGDPAVLRVRAASAGRLKVAEWGFDASGARTLTLLAGVHTGQDMIAALRTQAQTWFAGRVEEYCYRLGVSVPRVGLTNARTRWGSCSPRSGIRLHWRLLHLPQSLSDYVVAHEVAHLQELNHSPRFWAVVERLYPDWRSARVHLHREAAGLPIINPAAVVQL